MIDLDGRGVPADPPLLRQFPGWSTYRSAAQRWAVRMVSGAPAGGCVLTVLATGGGKTLTFLLPMLERRSQGQPSATLLIVPTISLMSDVAEGLRNRYPTASGSIQAFESHSGIPWEQRRVREAQFFNGELDVLVVSAERALRPDFVEALARMGASLAYLVIDEAHLIADWGEGFRHDFQRLGWLRSRLLESNSHLRTELLSATVPISTEIALRDVMRVPDHLWRTVRGTSLRFEAQLATEPQNGRSREASTVWLRRQLDHLETPGLIYVTKPEHAEELAVLICDQGRRAAAYHGETPNRERETILRAWHDEELDFVVGTSAFGLGIDKANVRTVIHLCIPESLDRLYQEIGRAGRDGAPCQATIVTVAEDIDIARANAKRLLTEQTARRRWEQLIENGQLLVHDSAGCFWLVDEEAIPTYWTPKWWSANDLTRVDLHTAWNKSLVNFFQRCGYVRYHGPFIATASGRPTKQTRELVEMWGRPHHSDQGVLALRWQDAPDGSWQDRRHAMDEAAASLADSEVAMRSVLEIVDLRAINPDAHVAAAFWAEVESRRQAELDSSYRAITAAVEYARKPPRGCLRQPFAVLYGESLETCGACSWCQDHYQPRNWQLSQRPCAPWPSEPSTSLKPELERLFEGEPQLLVRANPVPALIEQLERAGISQVIAPTAWASQQGTAVFHPLEAFSSRAALVECRPTAVLLPGEANAGDTERAFRQLAALSPTHFGNPGRLLFVVGDRVTWPGLSDDLDRTNTVHWGVSRLQNALSQLAGGAKGA